MSQNYILIIINIIIITIVIIIIVVINYYYDYYYYCRPAVTRGVAFASRAGILIAGLNILVFVRWLLGFSYYFVSFWTAVMVAGARGAQNTLLKEETKKISMGTRAEGGGGQGGQVRKIKKGGPRKNEKEQKKKTPE